MGTGWRESASRTQLSATRARIVRIAARQRNLIATVQLAEIGLSGSSIRSAVKVGRLHRTVFKGVYSLAPPPLGPLETIKAAALACGHPSLPSHWSATDLLGIAEPSLLPVHITNPTGSGRGREHIVVHRSIVLPRDTAGRNGILCTSAARTVFDLAALAEPDELERVLIAADSRRILNRRRLQELIDGSPGRRGIRTLRSLVAAGPVRVRSDLETDVLLLCRRAGLPEPVVNGTVAGLEVDLHWPALRLVVEVDGWRFHGGRERANADRDRDQRLALTGWRVVRFTRDQLAAGPAECARRLAALAETGTPEQEAFFT